MLKFWLLEKLNKKRKNKLTSEEERLIVHMGPDLLQANMLIIKGRYLLYVVAESNQEMKRVTAHFLPYDKDT